MSTLLLSGNQFNGSLPDTLVQMNQLTELRLQVRACTVAFRRCSASAQVGGGRAAPLHLLRAGGWPRGVPARVCSGAQGRAR